MYIPEIFNHFPGASRFSSESNQVVESDLQKYYTHLIIPSNGLPQTVYFTN